MKALLQQHQLFTAVGRAAVVLAAVASVSAAQARPNTPPDPSAPRLLITTFRMAPGTKPVDGKLGVEMAQALRDRIPQVIDEKQLWVVPRVVINQTLSTSGYPPDSALQVNDALALGKIGQIGSSETIDGMLTRLPNGDLELASKFYYNNKPEIDEPFAPVTGKTTAEIAKAWAETYKGMRKEIPEFKKCERALGTTGSADSAATYGRNAIAVFPTSVIGRLCLITAFDKLKSPPDSTIKVGLEILARDSTSAITLDYLRLAYEAKGDVAKSSEYAVKIFNLDPGTQGKAQTVINAMVNAGSPQKALPIVDTLIATNPGDKEPYITKLKILLKMGSYKEAYTTADLVTKIDTSVGTLDFYRQMIAAAQKDSDAVRFRQYLAKATAKFPKEADLQMGYYQALRDAGQLQEAVDAAKRAVAADAHVPGGMIAIIGVYLQLNQADSAFAAARKALASGADSSAISTAILPMLTPIYKTASAANNREAWQTLLNTAEKLDSIVPGIGPKFFTGLAAGSIGALALQTASEAAAATRADAVVACADAALTEEMFDLARTSMSQGGRYNPEGAKAIMDVVSQYASNPGQIIAALKCKKTPR